MYNFCFKIFVQLIATIILTAVVWYIPIDLSSKKNLLSLLWKLLAILFLRLKSHRFLEKHWWIHYDLVLSLMTTLKGNDLAQNTRVWEDRFNVHVIFFLSCWTFHSKPIISHIKIICMIMYDLFVLQFLVFLVITYFQERLPLYITWALVIAKDVRWNISLKLSSKF